MPIAVLPRTREKMLGLYIYKLSCVLLHLVCALSLLSTAVSPGAASYAGGQIGFAGMWLSG